MLGFYTFSTIVSLEVLDAVLNDVNRVFITFQHVLTKGSGAVLLPMVYFFKRILVFYNLLKWLPSGFGVIMIYLYHIF